MAETTARLKIQAIADLKGFEFAGRAIKALTTAAGPADQKLEELRQSINAASASLKTSEAAINAQIAALTKVRAQAQLGGATYQALTADINKLKGELGTSEATVKKFGAALAKASSAADARQAYRKYAEDLNRSKQAAGEASQAFGKLGQTGSKAFYVLGTSIKEAQEQLAKLKQNSGTLQTLFSRAGQAGPLSVPAKGLRDIQAFSQLVRRLKEQSETAVGKVARLSEGMAALGATGVALKGVTTSLGGVAGAAQNVSDFAAQLTGSFASLGAGAPQYLGPIKAALNQIALLANQPANGIAQWAQSLQGAQSKLIALNAPLDALNQGIAAIGPEGALMAGGLAVAFASLQDVITRAFRSGEKEASEALQGITNETQALLRKLSELGEAFKNNTSLNQLQGLRSGALTRFNDFAAGTDPSRRAANTIANAESRIKAEQAAQAQVLEAARQRYRGTTESVDALSERLSYLQQAMKLVDQSTAEGNAEFASFAREADQVKRRIDQLGNSYRTVADAIRDASQAQGQYANQSTVGNYFNRAAARRQEEIAAAAREQLARPQTMLLPAAGGTSFSGPVDARGMGGGARLGAAAAEGSANYDRNRPRTEIPFRLGFDASSKQAFMGATRSEAEISAAAGALQRQTQASGEARAAADRLKQDLKQLEEQAKQSAGAVNRVFSEMSVSAKGSINALREQREYWEKLRNSVDATSKEFRQADRELQKLDGRLERLDGRGNRLQRIGQTTGAIAASGVFGGPEGLVGAGVGAFFGPGGALAGGAIGAQVGQFRQQLGGFSTYAADIEKQKIALQGVTGSLNEYQRALQATAAVSRDFNIPQLEATKQMTQLSAAVIGAGGKVADAEVVFRNVTAAIKASGGSAEDVQGSLVALAQIFSKGKVSAEELQGQLGERLPGAVTMFAEATGRTLPQLQKDLEQGVVGLNDLMKFIVSPEGLGKFESTAKRISQSSADAGARLVQTFNDTKQAIGAALAPLGAEIQDSLANALKAATPALVASAKAIAGAIKVIVDNAGAIGNLVRFVAQMAAVNAALKLMSSSGLRASITALWATFNTGAAGAAAASTALLPKLLALRTTLQSIARIGLITVGVEIVVRGMAKLAEVQSRLDRIAGGSSKQFEKQIGGSSQTRERLSELLQENISAQSSKQQQLKGIRFPFLTGLDEVLKGEILQLQTREAVIRKLLRTAPKASQELTKFDAPDVEGKGKKGKTAKEKKGPESRAAELTLELNLLKQLGDADSLIADARLKGDERQVLVLNSLREQTRLVTEAAKIQLEEIPAKDKALKLELLKEQALQESVKLTYELAGLEKKANEDLKEKIKNAGEEIKVLRDKAVTEREYAQLIEKGSLPATARQYLETKKVVDETIRAAEAALAKAEADGASADEIERQRKELERIKGEGQAAIDSAKGADAPAKIISDALTRMRGELNELLNIGNQVVGAAEAIGDAFANSFKGLITGTTTAKEALGNFFQSIANYFADMAAQIIAEAIKMQAVKFVANIIGSLVTGGVGGGSAIVQGQSFDPSTVPGMAFNAKGNAFGANGIVPYAKGGIVSKPTLFQFAKGTGLMGEAGPEAIIPLKRGPDGRLGVSIYGSGGQGGPEMASSARILMGARANQDAAMLDHSATAGGYSATSAYLDQMSGSSASRVNNDPIKIETRVINGVEYVTSEQLQQATMLAEQRGAERGRSMTMNSLQNSIKARKRLGMA